MAIALGLRSTKAVSEAQATGVEDSCFACSDPIGPGSICVKDWRVVMQRAENLEVAGGVSKLKNTCAAD